MCPRTWLPSPRMKRPRDSFWIVHADIAAIVGQRVDDAKITAEVKAKLTAQHAKNLVNVNVDTKQGVVHLEGVVPTERDRALAESTARDIKGVVAVHNELKITVDPAALPRQK